MASDAMAVAWAEMRMALPEEAAAERAPIVIVGAGPVGVRCAQELHRRDPQCPIVLYGDEACAPYNRVKLSSVLAGEASWLSLEQGAELPQAPHVEARLGCRVVEIDRAARCTVDAQGRRQPYAHLMLATGSRPRVPDVPGIGQANVFVFRDLADVQRLVARRLRSRRTVVLGGGLLGLEAARAMRRFHTEVWVIEHGTRLMGRQLDDAGAALLSAHARRAGLTVLTGQRVKAINGYGRVEGVTLRSGERIDCDTVIVAAGIQPNIDLALDCGLNVGRGVRVDDRMRTSDAFIYAIGECAEHRGRVYGLVAPGLEQAGVAVHDLLEGPARYEGSLAVARLKVLDLPVFSLGEVSCEREGELTAIDHDVADRGVHRRLLLRRNRLVGAIAVGPCDEMNRLQEAVLAQRPVWPWQALRFRRTGSLWGEEEFASVVHWPTTAIVCNCNGVTRGQLGDAMAAGCRSVESLAACTRASTVCGSCKPLLAELAGAEATAPPPVPRALAATAMLALLFGLAVALLPGLPYMASVQAELRWDAIWRDSLLKQISGFAVLGLGAAGLLLSLRKRVRRVEWGRYDLWRLVHVVLGLLALIGLYAHTGGRLGSELNLLLMLSFTGLIVAGGFGAGVIAFEQRLPRAMVRRWRERSLWLHVLLLWPVPVLLGFHVLKSYYF